jgi:hypothetical protein
LGAKVLKKNEIAFFFVFFMQKKIKNQYFCRQLEWVEEMEVMGVM